MRILVISTPIFKLPVAGYSGLEHLVWLTAKGLAEKGNQVTIVAPEGSTCPGTSILSIGKERTINEDVAWGKYRNRLNQYDVVIDHSWHKFAYLSKMRGEMKKPLLGVCHAPLNTMYETLPPVEKPSFICISQDQASHFENLYNAEARVVYNGVDTEFYKRIDLPKTGRYLFLARFSTIKGPDLAIEACLKAGVGLDLVGDTSITQEPQLLEHCKYLSHQSTPGWKSDIPQIRIIGPATRSECVYWFSQSRALIHLNERFREPFGLAPVEAMLCGLPVLAWKYGAMKETIGQGGKLVKSFDQAVNILKNGDLDTISPVTCRENASRFSVQAMVDWYQKRVEEAHETGGW